MASRQAVTIADAHASMRNEAKAAIRCNLSELPLHPATIVCEFDELCISTRPLIANDLDAY